MLDDEFIVLIEEHFRIGIGPGTEPQATGLYEDISIEHKRFLVF
jgi:hypothetical protein